MVITQHMTYQRVSVVICIIGIQLILESKNQNTIVHIIPVVLKSIPMETIFQRSTTSEYKN